MYSDKPSEFTQDEESVIIYTFEECDLNRILTVNIYARCHDNQFFP